MENIHNIVIIGAMSSLALLWGFAAIGGLASLWDTFGEHVEELAQRLKR
tara:strand:- start:1467 stop:1613 length:147 start_codon:yes stop_codon:yes gene_type:complete